MSEERPILNYRRNLISLSSCSVAFIVGMAFSDSTSVLPTFARMLNASAPLIGMISALQAGGWLLPQLIAANVVANKERKKPYMIGAALAGRPLYFALAAITFFLGKSNPALTLLALFFCNTAFYACDGVSSVPWFDIIGKAIPGRRRGRYLGISQTMGGLCAVGAGLLVQRVLDPGRGLAFPENYALLFLLAAIFYTLSTACASFVREPIEATHTTRPSWRDYGRMLVKTLRQDRPYRLAVITRLLVGMGSMATPFFILYGAEGLGMGTGIVGLCLTMQVIGRAVGGLWLGVGIEKVGSKLTVLGGIILNLFAPLLALALSFSSQLFDPRALPLIYSFAFLGLGAAMNAVPMGLSNYILDIAPAKDRSTYVGLTNTISGLLIVAPILGGALLEFSSYGVLFAVTLAIYALAVLAGWRMPTAREAVSA